MSSSSASRSGQSGPPSRAGAYAALVGVQVLFGLHYLAAKIVVASVPPRLWAFLRAGSAGILLLGLALAASGGLSAFEGIPLREVAFLSIFGVAINQWLFVEGLHRTSPGHSALINAAIPVLVLVFASLAGRERLTARRAAGIVVTLAGVLLIIRPDRAEGGTTGVAGDLMSLGNALSYSVFLVLSKPLLERHRTLPVTALLLGCGAIILLPVGASGLWQFDPAALGGLTWTLAAFIVIGPTIGAYLLNTFALRRLESSTVASFIYLQPVIGSGLSLALGYDRPTAALFLAAGFVFSGLALSLTGSRSRAR